MREPSFIQLICDGVLVADVWGTAKVTHHRHNGSKYMVTMYSTNGTSTGFYHCDSVRKRSYYGK